VRATGSAGLQARTFGATSGLIQAKRRNSFNPMGTRLLLAGSLFVALAATSAQACNCPKEALIKKYGTVSMIRHPVPLQETLPTPDAQLPLPPLPVEPAATPAPSQPKAEPKS
jgi:hypothetical protein